MKTKNLRLAIVFLGLMGISWSWAQEQGIGVGGYLQAGNPWEDGGLDMKIFLSRVHAVDVQVSVEMTPEFGGSMGVYGSYLFHWWDVLPIRQGKLPLYVGPNLGFGIWDNGFALRLGGIGGMAYCLPRSAAPLDFYLQLNPVLEYKVNDGAPNTLEADLFLQLGFRVFF